MPIYRLVLDENGTEDCRDFTLLEDAYQEWRKAKRRKTVFSARIDGYSGSDYRFLATVHKYEVDQDTGDDRCP